MGYTQWTGIFSNTEIKPPFNIYSDKLFKIVDKFELDYKEHKYLNNLESVNTFFWPTCLHHFPTNNSNIPALQSTEVMN